MMLKGQTIEGKCWGFLSFEDATITDIPLMGNGKRIPGVRSGGRNIVYQGG